MHWNKIFYFGYWCWYFVNLIIFDKVRWIIPLCEFFNYWIALMTVRAHWFCLINFGFGIVLVLVEALEKVILHSISLNRMRSRTYLKEALDMYTGLSHKQPRGREDIRCNCNGPRVLWTYLTKGIAGSIRIMIVQTRNVVWNSFPHFGIYLMALWLNYIFFLRNPIDAAEIMDHFFNRWSQIVQDYGHI